MSSPQEQRTPFASGSGETATVIPASESAEDFDTFQDKDLTWACNLSWADLIDNDLLSLNKRLGASPLTDAPEVPFTDRLGAASTSGRLTLLSPGDEDAFRALSYPLMATHGGGGVSSGSMEDDSTSEGEDWKPAATSASDESSEGEDINSLEAVDDDDDSDPDFVPQPAVLGHCTNCTAPLYGHECGDCGHNARDDAVLLNPASTSTSTVETVHRDVLIVWDERMLAHSESKEQPHPERPDRLRAIMGQLRSSGLAGRCTVTESREATLHELYAVHEKEAVDRVRAASEAAPATGASVSHLTSDTYLNHHTYTCARLAAGGAAQAAVAVVRGEASCSAAIIRPPGHHAESNVAMGFCFFNNAAVAARAAQAQGAKRVLILDWDVHHGNGTQHIFEDDGSILFISIHRHDSGSFYPGTGAAWEVGEGPGKGFTVNIPWNGSRVGDGDYVAAFKHVVLPVSTSFKPDLIIVSAGFDAAEGDPIGGCHVSPACFGWMASQMKHIAPLVLLLEGGYNLRSIALSTEACLRALMGEKIQTPAKPLSLAGYMSLCAVHKVQQQYWSAVTAPVGEGAALSGMAATARILQMQDGVPPRLVASSGKPASAAVVEGERKAHAHAGHKQRLRLQLKRTEEVRRRKLERARQILWQVSRSVAKAWWRRQLERKKHVRLSHAQAQRRGLVKRA